MTNLLEETRFVLASRNKTPENILWVGSRDGTYALSWTEFEKIADVNYDAGFGGQEVVSDLVVVGDGWWLSRGEYDGSEGWNFNTAPVLKESPVPFSKVKSDEDECWVTIEQVHSLGGKYGGDE